MKRILAVLALIAFVVAGCSAPQTQTQTVAKLNFPLPRRARYDVTDQQFEAANLLLQRKFSADTNQLAEIISPPCMIGPGLWHVLKESPYFSTPPLAKTTCKVPLANGAMQELPAALIQDKIEAANFRASLAALISTSRNFKFRLPTEKEFHTFWATIPFDGIDDALIVAEGNSCNVLILFSKGKPFWFEEVKHFGSKQ